MVVMGREEQFGEVVTGRETWGEGVRGNEK